MVEWGRRKSSEVMAFFHAARGRTPVIPLPFRTEAAPPAPVLVVAVDRDQPTAAHTRHVLDGLDEVILGRSNRRACSRMDRLLSLGVADRRMSAVHARLVRDGLAWRIEDAGSANGTRVNGVGIGAARLTDGDVIEVGHTLLLFRAATPGRLPPLL